MEPEFGARALRTPRSAAYAGIAFAVLVTVSIVTVELAVPQNPADAGQWLADSSHRDLVLSSLGLMPLAGIAFLWFVGVVRDRIGEAEDRFFATLFLGSGLLFIAMLFAAEATAAGLVSSLGSDSRSLPTSDAWTIGRHVSQELMEGGLQMLGVFTIATSTITRRVGVEPRWLAAVGYGIAVLLIVAVYFVIWTALLFPIWVLFVSVDVLVAASRWDRAAREAPAR